MNDRKRNRKQDQKREKQAFKEAMRRELREHKSSFIVFYLLRVLVIVALVRQAMLRNYEGMFFCVLGHTFPVFYRFKGGKGVLCSAIGIAILSPYVFLILLLVFAILVAFTKYISLGSIVASAMYPLFLNLMFKVSYTSTPPAHAVLCSFVMAAMVVWMHRSNISRLWHGEENKLSFRHHEVNTSDKENGEDPEK